MTRATLEGCGPSKLYVTQFDPTLQRGFEEVPYLR